MITAFCVACGLCFIRLVVLGCLLCWCVLMCCGCFLFGCVVYLHLIWCFVVELDCCFLKRVGWGVLLVSGMGAGEFILCLVCC